MKRFKNIFKKVKVFIFDLDGTLYFKGKKFDYVDELIYELRRRNIILRFVTNTDSKTHIKVIQKLKDLQIDIKEDELFTPVNALVSFINNHEKNSYYFMVSKDVESYFKDLNENKKYNFYFYDDFNFQNRIDYVVIGDFSDRLTYDYLNKGLRILYSGGEILALAKFKVFFTQEGVNLNTGAFVNMFENILNRDAYLIGKPSKEIALYSLNGLNMKNDEVIIVGDDINVDILLAKNIRAYSILLRQGHFIEEKNNIKIGFKNKLKPTFIFDSIEDLYKNINLV